MKTFKKSVAILLAVMMVVTAMAMSFSVSAAETLGTVNVTSNVANTTSVVYKDYNEQLKVYYYLKADNPIVNVQAQLTYDSSVLEVASEAKAAVAAPTLSTGSTVINYKKTGNIYFNASNTNLYDFSTKATLFTATFNIIGSGNTTVDLNVKVLTENTGSGKSADDNYLVNGGTKLSNGFTVSSWSKVTGEEPPAPTGATIKVAAPVSTYAASYAWNNAVLFYGDTSTWDNMTQITMQDSGDVYYTAETFNSTIITPGAWKIYTVTLTDAQATAISAAKFVGFGTANGVNRTTLQTADNVLKAATGSYNATYGSTASSISDLDGKTFVFAESRYGAKSASSYKGYWVDSYVTVRSAAPVAKTAYSTWDSMSLFYGETTTFADMNTIKMVSAGKTTKVTDLNDAAAGTIRNGRWYIYAVTLNGTQAAAVEAAKYAGFCKTDATNRTNLTWNVLKAKTNTYTGAYNTSASTLSNVEDKVFIINSQTKTGNSVATYVGYWATEDKYTQGDADKVTIYFAAPKAAKDVFAWDTGVELFYGVNVTDFNATERLEMTKTNQTTNVTVDSSKLSTLKSGNWDVYKLELDVDQINTIDACGNVGFNKKGSFNRTPLSGHRNITKASKTDDTDAYSGYKSSIETFDGCIFVINGYYESGAAEQTNYTGKWHTYA